MKRLVKYSIVTLASLAYLGYFFLALRAGGPVDFDTFMDIGRRWNAGLPVWQGASYYPLPMVLVFSVFSLLPRPVSLFIWLFVPVILAIIATGAWGLGPLTFVHFAGGQSVGVPALGFLLFKKTGWISGVGLAIMILKPQLAIVPLVWAAYTWYKSRSRASVISFLISVFILWGIPTILYPWWISAWIGNLRPLSARAMEAIIPRSLIWLTPGYFWPGVLLTGAVAIVICARYKSLDLWFATWFIVSPLVHNYDLFLAQFVSKDKRLQIMAIPMLITLLTQYENNAAWWTSSIIGVSWFIYSLTSERNDVKYIYGAKLNNEQT